MRKRVSPGFYNTEMESKYFHLYIQYWLLNRKDKDSEEYKKSIIKFELKYYKVSKMNKILNDISKEEYEIIKYLEPSGLKKKVDAGAKKLGITPFDELNRSEQDFVFASL